MCRSKDLGGRRCPQYTDPVKHAAYNARRRELYAARKAPAEEVTFLDFSEERPFYDGILWPQVAKFADEAEAFAKIVNPDFDRKSWRDHMGSEVRTFETENISEAEALIYYTDMGYTDIRNYLAQGTVMKTNRRKYTDEEKVWMDGVVSKIDSALEKAPKAKEQRTLYRGMRIPASISNMDVDGWMDHTFPVGGVISQPSYMSTSLNAHSAASIFGAKMSTDTSRRAVLFEIISKQGTPIGKGLASPGNHEMEVLLPRNAKLKVAEVHKTAQFSYRNRWNGLDTDYRTVIRLVDVTDEDES
jgi:hypothetical protein